MRWSSGDYLAPRLLQIIGLLILIVSGVFWAVTGRESVLIISSAMTLIAGGSLRGAWASVKEEASQLKKEP